MDQNSPAGLINQNDLFQDLGLDNLPEEKKAALMQTMIDTVMNRIFNRVSTVLTESDMQVLQELQSKPDSDQIVNQYLVSRVPNLDGIAAEEVEAVREEMKASAAAVNQALSQQQ